MGSRVNLKVLVGEYGGGAEGRQGCGGIAAGALLYAIRYAASSDAGTLYSGIRNPRAAI